MKLLQRVTNCMLVHNNKLLLLQKPSRGWWVAPGGKMESGESMKEAVVREIFEETGLRIQDPRLRGVFSIVIKDKEQLISEWMMFTFQADKL